MNVLCSTANYTQKPYFQFRDDYRIQNGKELTKVTQLVSYSTSLLRRIYLSYKTRFFIASVTATVPFFPVLFSNVRRLTAYFKCERKYAAF